MDILWTYHYWKTSIEVCINARKVHVGFFIVDALIAAGVIGCGIIAYTTYYDRESNSDIQYFTVFSNETGLNKRWDVMLEYRTDDVFAARTVLNVTAVANSWEIPYYANAWIYFPNSINDPPQYQDANRLPAHIRLNFTGIDKFGHFQFKGNTTLVYPTGGEKVIEFWEKNQEVVFIDGVHERKVIDISSEDSKYQYETNKATLALAWVVIGLTIVIFRGFIKDFVEDFKWKNDKGKPPENPDIY
jgi:hypothetical protein